MDKARELLDRFFCIPNVALYLFVVVMLSLCVGIVAFGAYTAKPMMSVDQCAVVKEATK